jgi:hypothetical protein
VLQLLLGAAIAGGGFVGVYWPGSVESFFGVLGLLLAVVGALLVVLGVLSLGSTFTPLPRPRARTRLRQGGIFRLVRHPVYGGAILAPERRDRCSTATPSTRGRQRGRRAHHAVLNKPSETIWTDDAPRPYTYSTCVGRV